ncbi:radical SAM protein [Streptomyces sp. NPDC048251]|uniref:radical SAM protein n=1 Tax=unclassified Streptomyces TaxID=2593676 RepID=UPI00342CFA8F
MPDHGLTEKGVAMRLAELMALRQRIVAGALVSLTERCPLSCAHCSTAATRRGRDLDSAALLGFLRTFTPADRPDVLMLTGGEPLLRPGLVIEAAVAARARGTRTAVLSGAFFADGGSLPPTVCEVARAVDHFSLSLDAFHERQVPRRNVFDVLDALLGTGVAVSLHLLADGPADPYPDEVGAQVRRRFGTDVPMLVGQVRPVGRGGTLRPLPRPPAGPDPWAAAPCDMAAWPVVTTDGTVTACCNQDVADRRVRPGHLGLGDIRTTTWQTVRERAQASPMLRMIRTVGPVHIATRAGLPAGGYCATCHRLDGSDAARDWTDRAGTGPAGELLQSAAVHRGETGGPAALVARHGPARHAHLVDPGQGPAVRPRQEHTP